LHKPTASVAHERLPGKRELQMNTEVVSRLAQVWSSNDFIRSASLPKQACILSESGQLFHCVNQMKIKLVTCRTSKEVIIIKFNNDEKLRFDFDTLHLLDFPLLGMYRMYLLCSEVQDQTMWKVYLLNSSDQSGLR